MRFPPGLLLSKVKVRFTHLKAVQEICCLTSSRAYILLSTCCVAKQSHQCQHTCTRPVNAMCADDITMMEITLGWQVAFDDLPFNTGKTSGQRREYWEKSRRLQHGTLVALWWDSPAATPPRAQQASDPCITFATISMRNEQQLAPREAGHRPQIGIRCSLMIASSVLLATSHSL